MKKVWIISFLVFGTLLSGCRSNDGALSSSETEPRPATTGRSFFWDKDNRPTRAVPAREYDAAPEAAEPQQETMAAETSGTEGASSTQPEVLTASIESLEPVTAGYIAPTYQRPAALGPDFVPVGGNILSITYPRPEYGILRVDKTMPREIRLNTPFEYVIRVTNLTDTMLTDVTLSESLSREFECTGSDPTAQMVDNKLSWEIDSLGPKASKSIKIAGVAAGTTQLEHCTAITHTMRDCAVAKVVQPALKLEKTAPTDALLCESIPVEFVVMNSGTGEAHNVQIVDELPAGLLTVDGKDRIVLEAGTLSAGESRRFSVKLRATEKGVYVNNATAVSATGIRADSEATQITVRQPVLEITKSGPNRQYLGRLVTYEITVVNKGDGPARDTMVEDVVPPGVTSIGATAGAQSTSSKLIWDLGTLEPNASKTVRVSYMPTIEGDLAAAATATAYCADPVTDSAVTSILGIATARLNVIDVDDPVEVGDTTTYTITVTNEGSASDSNVRIVCTLDDKLQYVSSAGATAGSIMGRTVSFAPLRTLEPQAKAIWRVVVKGTRSGDVRFRVAMHTDQISLPVEHTEATHIYQQYNGGN
jgi:uncharacterized repeat protein (TIGR01451 family)